MFLVVDSNVLLDYPQILQDEENEIVLITDVLKELDGLKKSENGETAFKARRAAIVISRNIGKIMFVNEYDKIKMTVDDKLLAAAETYGETGCLITNDVYLKVQATLRGIPTKGYGGMEDYSGVRTIYITPDENGYHMELDSLLSNGKLLIEQKPLRENEFIIVKDLTNCIKMKSGIEDYEVLYIGIYQNGKIIQINDPKTYNHIIIENRWVGQVKPRNPEQICLCYLLSQKDISILYGGGTWGCGKSYLANNYAIQELEKGHISKIVYVPNNAYTMHTMELGALPGDTLDKVIGQIGPLIDLIGIDEIHRLIDEEQLEVVPMSSIRGRSFNDAFIIVNEAQNLTEDHVKLLIGRCGDGSRIYFDGDVKQADSTIFRNCNGLRLLTHLSASEKYAPIFGTVKLSTIERSKTAQAAGYLDELMGKL